MPEDRKCKSCLTVFPETKEYFPVRGYKVSASDNKEVLRYKCRPCRAESLKRASLKRLYGINHKEYKQLLKQQKNKCAICENKFSADKIIVCVDHCHTTGEVRGVLCSNCNRALGLFRDNIWNLQKAIKYLLGAKSPNGATES